MYTSTNNTLVDEGTVYSYGNGSSIITGITITNTSLSNINISLLIGTTYILKDVMLLAGCSIIPVGKEQKIILNIDETIELTSDYTGSDYLSTVCSAMNIYSPHYTIPEEEVATPVWYGSEGVFGGGHASYLNNIDYVNISVSSDATVFGDLTIGRYGLASCSDGTTGLFAGGYSGVVQQVIDKVTIPIKINAVSYGSLTQTKYDVEGCSDGTVAIWSGGYSTITRIETTTISSLSLTVTWGGVLTESRYRFASACDGTNALFASDWSYGITVDHIVIAIEADATDFGDLTVGRGALGACGDDTRAVFMGGYSNNTTIDYFTFATASDAIDFGDLTIGKYDNAGVDDNTIGLSGGGYSGSTANIDKITIATEGNATVFGNLTLSRYRLNACSGN